MQMPLIFARRTLVVSGSGSAAKDRWTPTRLAALAAERPAKKRRRLWMNSILRLPSFATIACLDLTLAMQASNRWLSRSRLQLALQLIKEAKIGSVCDDLLRAGLDHARLLHAQGVETQRVFRIEIAPDVIANVPQRLPRDFVVPHETSIDQLPGSL